jgi:hypothetical protein
MKKNKLEYRMYGLVPYNISPIQQGIQYGHAVDEYGIKKSKITGYRQWVTKDKTYIILNGGTTNLNKNRLGTLNKHRETLMKNRIPIASFYEPDLGDQLTGVCFLVDERVFDKKKYPDESELDTIDWINDIPRTELRKILFLREFLSQFRLA